MLDAVLVDNGVRGDDDRDREPKAGAPAAPHAADEQDSSGDEQHADDLPRRGRRGGEHDCAEEHEHGRKAACKRIDDGQLRAAIRRREQREVDELERRARGDERPGGRMQVPPHGRDRGDGERGHRQCDRSRRLDVPR